MRLISHKSPVGLLVIVGPTSSGKSELAVQLAKKFNGEIISCDSRQIYRGLNLGTGKVPGKWTAYKTHGREFYKPFVYKSIVHHCIDFVSPKRQYSAALFQRKAKKAIDDIASRGKLPILSGGTAHWVDAVVYNQNLPEVKPNKKLRAQLEKKSAHELYQRLIKLDPVRAKTIDRFNKRRLIRALEIIIATGKPVPEKKSIISPYHALWIGINVKQKSLNQKIQTRLKQRLKVGMIKEVKNLRSQGLSLKRLEDLGLEYRFIARYLRGIITYDEMSVQLLLAIKHYSKRQMTWWKRNKEIKWLKPETKLAANLIRKFLKLKSGG